MGCVPTKLHSSRSYGSIASIPGSLLPDPSCAISSVEEAARRLHQLLPLNLNSLELKQAISNTKELQILAYSYLNNGILNVRKVLSHVDPCIEKAYVKLRVILEVISTFQEELESARNGPKKNRNKKINKKKKKKKIKKLYRETLSKLKEFKLADDPLEEVKCEQLVSLQATLKEKVTQLRQRKRHLESRVISCKSWRKAWDVLFTGAFMAVLVVSVALAAVGAAPAAVTGATATATAMKAGETWLKSIWDEREKKLEEEEEVVQAMRAAAAAGVEGHELENVRAVVEKLRVIIMEVRQGVEFSLVQGSGDEEGLRIGMEEIKKKIIEVYESLAQLKEQMAVCAEGLDKGVKEFLMAIIK